MTIIDFKKVNHRYTTKYYKTLDKELVNCETFAKQRQTLLDRYETGVFSRDMLVRRHLSLKNVMCHDLSWETNVWVSFLVGTASAIMINTIFIKQDIGIVIMAFASLVVGLWFGVKRTKKRRDKKDIPVYEIMRFELSLLEKVLSEQNYNQHEFSIIKMMNGPKGQGDKQ